MRERSLRLALIGKDVSKSDSEKIHKFILKKLGIACQYERISLPQAELDGVVTRLLGDFDGFNVTIPYKRDVMGYLDEIVGDAFAFGAVNTVVCRTKTGYNTDGVGFLQMLDSAGIDVKGKSALVLGGGGSGRSGALSLKNGGAEVYMYRRNRAALEEICKELGVTAADDPERGGFDILVNATGVGMHDTEGQSPVGAAAFKGAESAIDLIYTPCESEFLRLARSAGVRTLNGAAMLFYQAYYSDCYYLEKQPNSDEAARLYEAYLKEE